MHKKLIAKVKKDIKDNLQQRFSELQVFLDREIEKIRKELNIGEGVKT